MAGYQSTYRVQLSGAFPFAAARAVVPYLADLGVSHLYTSPILRARSGSAHGYDVVDPTQVAPELGEWATFFAAGAAKRAAAEAGLSRAVTEREADDLVRDVGSFLAVVETSLGALPEPPRSPFRRPKPAPGAGPRR